MIGTIGFTQPIYIILYYFTKYCCKLQILSKLYKSDHPPVLNEIKSRWKFNNGSKGILKVTVNFILFMGLIDRR